MNYNINISNLDNVLKMRYNDKIICVIKDFLLEFVDKDINALDGEEDKLNKKTSHSIELIIENGIVVGIKIIYIPISILPEENYYDSSDDYKACCRKVLFDDRGGFLLESCNIDFDIFTSEKFNHQLQYSIEINRYCYNSLGIMISKNYGVKRKQLKKITLSNLILMSEAPSISYAEYLQEQVVGISSYRNFEGNLVENILNLENYFININYVELFDEGFKILEHNLEDFSDPKVILLVECVRVSHDVAFIKILKGIYTVPSKFEAYFNLANDFMIKLPDISFPRHLDHGEYELDYTIEPKSLDKCVLELERAVELGSIDEKQKDFLIRLCQTNSRDNLNSVYFEYGTIKRFGKS